MKDLHYTQQKNADRQATRVKRMVQVAEAFASGFTLRPVGVRITKGGSAPAFSSSDRIWFNEDMLADLTTREGALSVKGLTIHEICHILFTPRTGTDLRQWVISNKYFRAFNALEDQRIESHLLSLYPSVRDWLVATMNEYLLKSPQQWRLAFPLIHGRKYLDPKARGIIQRAFIKQDIVAELGSVIDAYRVLNLSDFDDQETAKSLIARYSELTEGLGLTNPNGHDSRSNSEQETNASSPTISRKKQKQASEKLEQEPDEPEVDLEDFEDFDWASLDEPKMSDGEPEDDDSDEDDDPDFDDWESDGDEYDSSDDDSWEWDDDSSDDSDSDGDSTEDYSPEPLSEPQPNGDSKESGGSPVEELKRLLNQATNEVMERLEDKLANDISLYNGDLLFEGEVIPEPQHSPMEYTTQVSAESAKASERFGFELKRLRAEYDAGWARRVDSGRINPARWEQGCEFEEAFDRFESGRNDATDIEAVVLLDVSGSMGRQEREAHEAMWAIKHALDEINASTSVVTYASHSFTLYSKDEGVGSDMRVVPASGMTEPLKALQYAQGVLANSTRAIRLLITITDGAWQESREGSCNEIISNLRNGGVITSLAWLYPYSDEVDAQKIDSHDAEIVCHVRNGEDLFNLGRAIVEVGIARNLVVA